MKVVLLLLIGIVTPAWADSLPDLSGATSGRPLSKKDAYLLDKARAKTNPTGKRPAVGKRPTKLINLFNTWTDEWIAVDAAKPTLPQELAARFLRCHFTNQPAEMDDRLIPTLVAAAKHFKVSTVNIVSGFRHPKYNLMLRKKGHEVARDSQHTRGTAIDFWLPGVSVPALHTWATAKRLGGVGLYLGSGFVHMDTGPVRAWNGQ